MQSNESSLASRGVFSLDILKRSLEQMAQTLAVPSGGKLFNEGDQPEVIYYLFTGRIRLSVERPGRDPVTIRVVGPGEILELGSLFDNQSYQATAIATEDCQVGYIRKATLLRYLDEHSEARLPLLQMLSRDVDSHLNVVRKAR